jgi:hypothetical protein
MAKPMIQQQDPNFEDDRINVTNPQPQMRTREIIRDVVRQETQQPVEQAQPEPQIQYVAVPRAVSVEEMLNVIHAELQEIKAILRGEKD